MPSNQKVMLQVSEAQVTKLVLIPQLATIKYDLQWQNLQWALCQKLPASKGSTALPY